MVDDHRVAKLLDDAQYYEDHRMWLHAVQVFERLIHDYPQEWNLRVRLGNVYLEMGNLKAAEQVLLQALRYDSQNPEVIYALGIASYQSGDLDRALYYLQQVAGKKLPKVHYSLGMVYWRRMEFGHAERHLRQALELEPTSADTAVALGETCLRNGKTGDAVEFLRKASKLQPVDDIIESSLGQALISDGKPSEAALVFDTMLRRNPENREAARALASVLVSSGSVDEAEQLLKRSIMHWPDDASMFVMLGRISLLKANRARAEEYLRRALEIDPDQEEALEQLRYFAPHGNPST